MLNGGGWERGREDNTRFVLLVDFSRQYNKLLNKFDIYWQYCCLLYICCTLLILSSDRQKEVKKEVYIITIKWTTHLMFTKINFNRLEFFLAPSAAKWLAIRVAIYLLTNKHSQTKHTKHKINIDWITIKWMSLQLNAQCHWLNEQQLDSQVFEAAAAAAAVNEKRKRFWVWNNWAETGQARGS